MKNYNYYQKYIYHNHTLQTNAWHREVNRTLTENKTPGRQLKQSNQLSLPRQNDYKTRKDTKLCIPKFCLPYTKISNDFELSPNWTLHTLPDYAVCLIYTTSKAKHHQNIFSVTVFMYNFLQKNNKFVTYRNPRVSLVCQHIRMPFDTFDKILRCLLCTNSHVGGISLKAS